MDHKSFCGIMLVKTGLISSVLWWVIVRFLMPTSKDFVGGEREIRKVHMFLVDSNNFYRYIDRYNGFVIEKN